MSEIRDAFHKGLDMAAGADLSFVSKGGDDYARQMHDESKRLKTIAREMNEEVPKVTLNCKICGAEIDAHYGEVTLTIQPHVIQDGSFWKIDQYNPDIYKQDIVCEPCIIELWDKVRGFKTHFDPTWSEIWDYIKLRLNTSYYRFRYKVRSYAARIRRH